MSLTRVFAKNSFFLTASTVVNSVLTMVLVISLARGLGAEIYGQLAFINALMAYFKLISEFGMGNIVIRDVSQDKSKTAEYLTTSIILKLIASILSIVTIYILIHFFSNKENIYLPIYIFSLSLIPCSISTSIKDILKAYQIMEYNAMINTLQSFLALLIGIIILYLGYGLFGLLFSFLILEIFICIVCVFIYIMKIHITDWYFKREKYFFIIRNSFPILIWQFVSIVYYKIDIIMLSSMKGDTAVGLYSSAYKLIDMIVMTCSVIFSALLPALSQVFKESKDKWKIAGQDLLKYIVVIFLPICFLIFLFSEKIILVLYGKEYADSILVLKVVIWSAFFIPMNFLFGTLLLIVNKQKIVAALSLIPTALNIGLNLILIPGLAQVGAAISTLVGECCCFVIFFPLVCRSAVGLGFIRGVLKPALAALPFVLCLVLFRNPIAVMLLALGGYFVLLWLLSVITSSDLFYLKKLMPSARS